MYNKYRVYDNQKKEWIMDSIYESPFGDLWSVKKGLFGNYKLELLSDTRYTRQRCTGLLDANEFSIYEGDICITKKGLCNEDGKEVKGVVSYYPDSAQYFLFDYKKDVYYPLNDVICKFLEIIGNVKASPEFLDIENEEESMQDNTQEEVKEQEITEETGD